MDIVEGRRGFTPLRGYTSSGAARHLPLKGKAYGGAPSGGRFTGVRPRGEGLRGGALGGKADGVQGEKKGSTRAGASLYVIRWR